MTEIAQTNSESEEYLATLTAYLDKELAQVKSHANWYKERAKREKRRFYAIRIPMILTSVIVSFLVSLEMAVQGISALGVASLSLSLLVGFLGSLDALLGYGTSWVEKRNAELALYSLQRKYKKEKLRIAAPGTIEDSVEIANAILDALEEEYEQVVAGTVNEFVTRSKESEAIRPGSS